MPGFDLGPENLAELLGTQTRLVRQGNWAVAAVLSSTELAVVCVQPAGAVPYIGATLAAAYVGCEIEFTTGVLAGLPNAAGVSSGRFATVCTGISSSVTNGVLSTVITLADALPASPAPGDQFVVYERPPSLPNLNIAAVGGTDVPAVGGVPSVPVTLEGTPSVGGTVTANQGAAGTQAWPVSVTGLAAVTTDPSTVANVAYGTSVTAGTGVLSSAYSVPQNGSVIGHVALASGATATTVLYTVDGTHYVAINQGQNLAPGAGYAFVVPVVSGATVNFTTGANTTLAALQAFFVPTQ